MRVLFFAFIVVCLSSFNLYYKNYEMESSEAMSNKQELVEELVKIPIITNDYKHIERSLEVDDFLFVKKGMSIEEIVGVLGEPNGTTGFGIIRCYYHLKDNSAIIIYEDDNGVCGIRHCFFENEGQTKGIWIMDPTTTQ